MQGRRLPIANVFSGHPLARRIVKFRFDALLLRYKIILWSESAQDWISQESEEIARKIKDRIAPGSIFLLHDAICSDQDPGMPWDRGPMLDGLEMALSMLKHQIHFVTVPELLRAGNPASNWPREVDPSHNYGVQN